MNVDSTNNLSTLIQQQLALEAQLAASLDELNRATSGILLDAGLKGPTRKDLHSLTPIAQSVQQNVTNVQQARQVLLQRVQVTSGKQVSTLKQVIDALPPEDKYFFEQSRQEILDRASKAQTALIQNQAALFYTYDFHRKYLAGVLQIDPRENNYRSDGQQHEVTPGNLFGKTC